MKVNSLAAVLLAVLGTAPFAEASPLGWSLTISEHPTFSPGANVPVFVLTNTSASGFDIVSVNVTIGDTARHFDYVLGVVASPGILHTLVRPDAVNAGLRTDDIEITFTGFAPGSTFQWESDIDLDPAVNSNQDFRTVMMGLTTPNSIVTVGFSNGQSLAFELPDATLPLLSSYSFSQTNIPEPGTWSLTLLAGVLLCARRIRKRPRSL